LIGGLGGYAVNSNMASENLKNVVVSDKPADCSVCLEKFTTTVRRAVSCPYCHEYFCVKCIEKYMMNSIEDPHCMACRRGWSQSLLQNFCTKTFLTKTYPEYRSTILLNRSKAFLPQYQTKAERVLASEKILKLNAELHKQFKELVKEEQKILDKKSKLFSTIRSNEYTAAGIINGSRDLEGNPINRENEIANERVREIASENNDETAKDNHKKFIRRCPAEGCNGFLSSMWKCGICQNWSCSECFAIKGLVKDAEHTCKEDDKATANLIRKNSKPCPNCGEFIEKSEGCDQMFCTACHSPFSWKKSEVIKTGIIHNPHYFEWLRRNGNNKYPQNFNAPCEGLPVFHLINNYLRVLPRESLLLNKNGEKNKYCFETIYQTFAHIIDVERNYYNSHNRPIDESKYGVNFLLKKISEEDWKQALKKHEMARLRSKEICDILDAFRDAAIDIWRTIEQESKILTVENYLEFYDKWLMQLNELRKFINEPLLQISKIYNCVVPIICNDWSFKTYSITKEKAMKKKKEKLKEEKAASDKTTETTKNPQ